MAIARGMELLLLMRIWKLINASDILFSVRMCSYMVSLEDTTNSGLCGLFLLMLAVLCFVAFSAVRVKFFHTF